MHTTADYHIPLRTLKMQSNLFTIGQKGNNFDTEQILKLKQKNVCELRSTCIKTCLKVVSRNNHEKSAIFRGNVIGNITQNMALFS